MGGHGFLRQRLARVFSIGWMTCFHSAKTSNCCCGLNNWLLRRVGADLMAEMGHEQVAFSTDPSTGYRGIIAINSTKLGPALGGTRFWNYSSEREAVVDALRLSRGMTYKNALAGLPLGGGKSIILQNEQVTDREAIFRAHGRFFGGSDAPRSTYL